MLGLVIFLFIILYAFYEAIIKKKSKRPYFFNNENNSKVYKPYTKNTYSLYAPPELLEKLRADADRHPSSESWTVSKQIVKILSEHYNYSEKK